MDLDSRGVHGRLTTLGPAFTRVVLISKVHSQAPAADLVPVQVADCTLCSSLVMVLTEAIALGFTRVLVSHQAARASNMGHLAWVV